MSGDVLTLVAVLALGFFRKGKAKAATEPETDLSGGGVDAFGRVNGSFVGPTSRDNPEIPPSVSGDDDGIGGIGFQNYGARPVSQFPLDPGQTMVTEIAPNGKPITHPMGEQGRIVCVNLIGNNGRFCYWEKDGP